jgi:hypothetical protein
MLSKFIHLLSLIISLLVFIKVTYIEVNILSQMIFFEEPTYTLYEYSITLKGLSATLIHIFNISLGLIAILTAAYCYKKLQD